MSSRPSGPPSPSTPSATARASGASSTPAASARCAWPARSSSACAGNVATYNGKAYDGSPTYGGYSTQIVVDESYALRIPDGISLDVAAPLLCAGITLYSPLKHWGAGPGTKVAIVGMGGLGHMGVQLAHALGAEVTVLSQSLSKQADGLALGADHYYATSDRQTFRDLRRSFDLIISTVGADIDVDAYLSLLRFEGSLVFVGLPENKQSFRVFSLTGGSSQPVRVQHRRHPRDPGDARLLRGARDRLGRSRPSPPTTSTRPTTAW